jgi:hypothetical protein
VETGKENPPLAATEAAPVTSAGEVAQALPLVALSTNLTLTAALEMRCTPQI